MGSKKHKKESKKKKHKSRSRSPLEGEEVRERKRHHKKHKNRKKDRSPDVQEVPVDSHLVPPEGSTSAERQRERDISARESRSKDNGDSRPKDNGDLYEPEASYEEWEELEASYYKHKPAERYEKENHKEKSTEKYREPEASYYKDKPAERYDKETYKESTERYREPEASYYKDRPVERHYDPYQEKSSERYREYDTYKERPAEIYMDKSSERHEYKERSAETYKERPSETYKERPAATYKERSETYRERPVETYKERPETYRERPAESYKERPSETYRERPAETYKERQSERQERPPEKQKEKSVEMSGGAQESLSIEETNRLRAKLGLKPLEVSEQVAEDGKLKDDLGEFYHRPAANIAEQKKGEKIKQKLDERREKRKLEQKLQATVTLAEGSDDEDALAWINKSRVIEQQKKEAAKRAAMLDEMDAVFGVSALVAEETQADRAASYTGQQLKGLRVAHDIDTLGDERVTILTLADKDVLAEDSEDVLVNVNMVDDEKYRKNIADRKKARAGYQAYDDEADLEAAALGYSKPLLAKYDEEIDKDGKAKHRGFFIGDEAAIEAKRFRDMMRQERLAGGPDKRLESLELPPLRPATQYLEPHEMEAKFKKVKKRGKMRKKAKEEPIDVEEYDAGTAPLATDDTEVVPAELGANLAVDEEEVEVDSELQIAVARARRLRQMEARNTVPKVEDLLQRIKEDVKMESEEADADDSGMVLDATAEFCRTLGDIPTYGLAGNRDHKAEIIDFEDDAMEHEHVVGGGSGAWSRVDVHDDKPPDITAGGAVALEPEPALGAGVAGALQLALSKGYLEKAGAVPAPTNLINHLLVARHYSIEDKTTGEDDKHGRRERSNHHGPLGEFREKQHFKPRVKLEYVDDDGRPLCPKEAFRYLSHKFHGKGPGKNKQEKRIKKQIQEGLMKKMSSTDTPLGTLQMLQDKQRETHSAYVVLSGQKRDNPH